MQKRTKILIATAVPLAAGAALAGLAATAHPAPPSAPPRAPDDSEGSWRDPYLDKLVGLTAPTKA